MVDRNISSKVEVFISCRNLLNKDTFSKSDPMALFYLKDGIEHKDFTLIDRTEVIDNNLNPDFKKKFIVNYHFERRQEVLIKVYDVDSKNLGRYSDHDFLGMARATLADLISRGKAVLPLTDKYGRSLRKKSLAVVRCNDIGDNSLRAKMTLAGDKLPKMDLFGKADPYLEIFKKSLQDNAWLPVAKTEVCKYTYNPRWKPLDISVAELCSGDRKRPLLFKCFDWDRNSTPDFIGEFETNLEDLESQSASSEFRLRKPKDARKRNPKRRGTITIGMKLYKEHTFLDYVRGGCQINLMVAIDFTASNGDPRGRSSLHYIGSGAANEYQKAIATIGNILTPYDSDNKYPVFGFGARIKRTNRVEHCFPLNMNEYDPDVSGVSGILNAYRGAFNHVLLSGPTYFSEVLATAAANASAAAFNSSNQEYTILLILTDGRYDDEKQSIDQIVAASTLPLSIIIVGVGKADFSAMEKLDGDDVRLTDSQGKKAFRDIVQFVPYREFKSPELLAKETLEEIPRQFIQFCKLKNVKPLDSKYDINASETQLPVLMHQPSAHVISRMPTVFDTKAQRAVPSQHTLYPIPSGSVPSAPSNFHSSPPQQPVVHRFQPQQQASQPTQTPGSAWWTPPVPVNAQMQPQVHQQQNSPFVPPSVQVTPSIVQPDPQVPGGGGWYNSSAPAPRTQQVTPQMLQAQIQAAAARMDFVTAQRLKEQLDKLTLQEAAGDLEAPPSYNDAGF